jgi:hypothetical protein
MNLILSGAIERSEVSRRIPVSIEKKQILRFAQDDNSGL